MDQIFVSYSRRDSKIVDQLISRLEEAGYTVWVDREDIQGGSQWRQAIVMAIDNCQVFISVLSPNSIASDNVRKEMDIAEGSKKPILPVMLQQIELPTHMRYQLAGLQIIDLSQDFETGFSQLIESLGERGVKPTAEPSATTVPRQTRRLDILISNRWVWVIIAVILLVVSSFILIINLKDGWSTSRQTQTAAAITVLTTPPAPTITITPTISPTPTDTPTRTITPTVLSTPSDTPTSAENIVLFQDDFSSNKSNWYVGQQEWDLASQMSEFVDEKLRVTVISKPDAVTGVSSSKLWVPDLFVDDFHIIVEATFVEVPDMAGIMVGFRDDNSGNNYVVIFNEKGIYEVWLRIENEWQPAIRRASLKDVMVFDVGGRNTIEIIVKDSSITIYANDQQLGKVSDTGLSTAGAIWIGVELSTADQTVIVDFDNLTVSEVP